VRTPTTPFILAASIAAAALLATACGSSSTTASGPTTTPSGPSAAAVPLTGAARCAANRKAGTITYLTGFAYQADTGILDVIAAKADGYYAAECLDVVIRPGTGDPGTAAQLVSAGRVTMAELGGPSDVLTVTAAGQHVKAIATYGNVPSITLLTNPSITNLRQLEGKTLGYKGAMPPQITAMLTKAGVDVKKVKEVGVGYDPTILPRGQVQALTAYKSNEPIELRDLGDKFREWDPDSFGIRGSFNTIVANPSFASAHPTAVEDFLRATFHAFDGCMADPAPCIAASARLQSGYDRSQNLQEWKVQSKEVTSSRLAGRGVGAQSVAQWTPEADLLTQDHLLPSHPDIAAVLDTTYVAAIEHGRTVVWPSP
jgi:ABC-type nitrate/sulfonate/bicarbonate transport system substrate-binding protein